MKIQGFNYKGLNLSNAEIENLMYKENHVIWHCSATCVNCGDHMFWMKTFNRWFCRSWLYMEGGCTHQEVFVTPGK